MKTRVIACSVVALSAAFGAIVQGQEPPPAQSDFTYWYALQTAGSGGRGGFFGLSVPIESQLVKGAPYIAEVVTESVQTLADGNRIVRRTTGRVYRDSQGRTRREDDREPGKVRTISIVDPVGGFSYSLNPESKIASKTPYRPGGAIAPKIAGIDVSADPAAAELRRAVEEKMAVRREQAGDKASQAGSGSGGGGGTGAVGGGGRARGGIATPTDEKVEKLPARQIEGVLAEGVRTTRTIPAGAIGNEQPIAIVTEEWRSAELQVLVLTRTADPRTGESTYKLLSIQRSEPNASWFDVPGDYTVQERNRVLIR